MLKDSFASGPNSVMAATNQQPRSTGVEYHVSELGYQVTNLGELLDCLHSKLGPVLMPYPPTEVGGNNKDGLMPAVSPVEEELIIITNRVRNLTGYVGELIERTQLNKN